MPITSLFAPLIHARDGAFDIITLGISRDRGLAPVNRHFLNSTLTLSLMLQDSSTLMSPNM